jgi:hypothetical protein
MPIPRIIHQTWRVPTAHPALNYCMESFQFMNPDWEWRFYTDEDCVRWVSERCPEMLKAYNAYQTGIHRADFFRILVLFFDGGVYADIDVECLRPLDELISRLPAGRTVYLTRDHAIHERIHFSGRAMWMNDFMIAEPGDPLMCEILNWMLNSPPTSANSSNAVNETGPGVISSVMEMLGGPEMVPGLGIIPTPWVHWLPDMNCGFPEKHFYGQMIAQRSWQQREVFVVHYWFHTWVGAKNNTLTDYADLLISTLGEQVERKLQWLLGADPAERDVLIASALAEFAEVRGTVRLHLERAEAPLVDRFLEVLKLSGLKPRIQISAASGAGLPDERIGELLAFGAEFLHGEEDSVVGAVAWSGKKLWVADPESVIERLPDMEEGTFDGLVLGPPVPGVAAMAEASGLFLTEVLPPHKQVCRVVHLLPGQPDEAWSSGALFFREGFRVRQWIRADVEQVLRDASLGIWNPLHLTPADQDVAAALAILYAEGGVIYQGDRERVAELLPNLGGDTFLHGDSFWLLACSRQSPLLNGALRHWVETRQRSRSEVTKDANAVSNGLDERVYVDMPMLDFLRLRLHQMQKVGLGGLVKVARAKMG